MKNDRSFWALPPRADERIRTLPVPIQDVANGISRRVGDALTTVVEYELDNIPTEIRLRAQWVNFRFIAREGWQLGDTKPWNKIPVDSRNGKPARPNQPETLERFPERPGILPGSHG